MLDSLVVDKDVLTNPNKNPYAPTMDEELAHWNAKLKKRNEEELNWNLGYRLHKSLNGLLNGVSNILKYFSNTTEKVKHTILPSNKKNDVVSVDSLIDNYGGQSVDAYVQNLINLAELNFWNSEYMPDEDMMTKLTLNIFSQYTPKTAMKIVQKAYEHSGESTHPAYSRHINKVVKKAASDLGYALGQQ